MVVIGQEMVFIAFAVLFIMVFASFIYVIKWRDKHKDF
jgi:hypothetical protein